MSRKRKAPEHSPEPEENHLSMAKRKHEGAEVRLVRARLHELWERKEKKQRELVELLQRGERVRNRRGEGLSDDILVLREELRFTQVTLREAKARALQEGNDLRRSEQAPEHGSP